MVFRSKNPHTALDVDVWTVQRELSDLGNYEIAGTLSERYMGDIAGDTEFTILKRGITTCETDGWLDSINNSQFVGFGDNCRDSILVDQARGYFESDSGDSGSLVYSQKIEEADNQRFAMYVLNGATASQQSGAQGYSIRDEHNVWFQ